MCRFEAKAGVTPEMLKAALMPLCNPKVKFLNYSGKKPVFADADTVAVNKQFQSKTLRNQMKPVKATTKKEVGPTKEEEMQNKALEKERACKIQAKHFLSKLGSSEVFAHSSQQ